MGHSTIHDQSARRREPGSLRLRFLHDYVVFDFYITSLLARCRCNVVNFDRSANDPHKGHRQKRFMRIVEVVQGEPEWSRPDQSK